MDVHLLVLNYNGRALLADCLPSVAAAARRYVDEGFGAARVTVIDNSSSDDSAAWLRRSFPEIEVRVEPNRGLCSFNAAVADSPAQVVVLLNNDLRLDAASLEPLVRPFREPQGREACFLTAARTLRASDGAYDGQKTAIAWRWGLVQATSHYEGHSAATLHAAWTASAGAAVAVDRALFCELGGFDPLYLPGRLEDLDLAFRAWQRGAVCRYVPEAVAYHAGAATFGREFGAEGCRQLALRNTILWQWKNLRRPAHCLRFAAGIAARLAWELAFWPRRRRLPVAAALRDAWAQRGVGFDPRYAARLDRRRERLFFSRFHQRRIDEGPRRPAILRPEAARSLAEVEAAHG